MNLIKVKASLGNLNIKYIDGHLIKINNTNLDITKPYKIIIKNNTTALIAYLSEDNDKISNVIIIFTKFTQIINELNKFI